MKNNYKILSATYGADCYIPVKFKKFKNYKEWIKGHVGNDLKLYDNDFDVKLTYQ